MKKNLLTPIYRLAIITCFTCNAFAQKPDTAMHHLTYDTSAFRHWSLGLNAGILSPYSLLKFESDFKTNGLDLGYGGYVNYQVSQLFGFRANFLKGNISASDSRSGYYQSFNSSLKYAADISASFTPFSIRFNNEDNFIRPELTFGYGLAGYQPTFTAVDGLPYKVDHNIGNAYVPVGLAVKVGLARSVIFSTGYTLNFVDGDNLDGYNYGKNNDRFSFFHIGLEFVLGNPDKQVTKSVIIKPKKVYTVVYDQPARVKSASTDNITIGNQDSLTSKYLNETKNSIAKINSRFKTDSDNDGVEDALDKCPGTPLGTVTDGNGCPVIKPEAPMSISVQFDFDSYTLRTSAYPLLDALTSDIRATPSKSIEISGYTSDEGTDGYNVTLSIDRANAVKTYLVNAGISTEKIKVVGYGKSHPAADNATEDGRIKNRRVEIKQY